MTYLKQKTISIISLVLALIIYILVISPLVFVILVLIF